mmetsp:Transcript_31047/g.75044  ORF Transcript_31047/g.75044 Transcript_31047/m.75044 type:complete len:110 (+) Transcript_31047:446-775(+)
MVIDFAGDSWDERERCDDGPGDFVMLAGCWFGVSPSCIISADTVGVVLEVVVALVDDVVQLENQDIADDDWSCDEAALLLIESSWQALGELRAWVCHESLSGSSILLCC